MIEPERLASFAAKIRSEGKSLVTINGSFDLLHRGHLEMLYQASLQGDFLLVLLNSDSSIKGYKSPLRPIRPLEERMEQIAAFEWVDAVSSFDELDPRAVLGKICPEVHVNGAEYGENCIEREVVVQGGGRIHIVPLISGYSSTNLIQRIRALCDSSAT